jgi:hypothetical protein
MSTNEINSVGRGVETYNLHSSCAFFVKADYLPANCQYAVLALAHEAGPVASLRNFKIGEVAFRAGPYKQGHRDLRVAKLYIVDDQTRLRCPMDEQPRLCPVNHDTVLGPYPRLQVHEIEFRGSTVRGSI